MDLVHGHAEDALARRTAREYGTFMHRTPWYQFPFGSRLAALWREVPLTGPHMVRKIERRMALTAEYAIKAVYGLIIRKASGAAYEGEDLRIYARVADTPLPRCRIRGSRSSRRSARGNTSSRCRDTRTSRPRRWR